MICYCPFCVNDLPDNLKDGVIFCPKCSRVIYSNKENELISAFRFLKKKPTHNWNQLKFQLGLDESDVELLRFSLEEQEYSVHEFEKYIKKVLCESSSA